VSRRVVITGLGAVSAAGVGVKEFWRAVRDGVSGVDWITRFDASQFTCRVAGEARTFDPRQFMSDKLAVTTNRFTQLGLAATRMAYDDAGLAHVPGVSRFPVCFGSSTAAAPEFQTEIEQFADGGASRISPSVIVEHIGSAVTNRIAAEFKLTGQTMALASGCTSALDVIQWAWGQIGSGRTAGALGGGADSPLSSVIQATWSALGSLSRWPGPPSQALRPFDAASTGTVLGEAGAAFVLEEYEHALARGAPIYAEVLGHGNGNAGLQSRTPEPMATAASLEAALRSALRAANLDVSEIDYISSHGGGVPKQDRGETAAYKAVFGRRAYNIPISSIKPPTGNTFSAGGALQVVAACFTLAEQFLPPTANLDVPDSLCDLDYVPHRGRMGRVNQLLIATRGIGPTYSAVVLAHPPTPKRRASP